MIKNTQVECILLRFKPAERKSDISSETANSLREHSTHSIVRWQVIASFQIDIVHGNSGGSIILDPSRI